MILKKKYIEEEKKQQVWYDSSMISYSEMRESEFENKGELIIIFKNGTAYSYKDVSYEDYLIFLGGGTDASQGKTLNKIIKGKYEYEKVTERINVEELLNQLYEKEDIVDNSNTYFISGHRNLTENEFEFYYTPILSDIIANNPDAHFVVGDSCGCDIMAQNYLINVLGVNPANITVYCIDTPDNINPEIIYLKTEFKTHDEKDAAMTKASTEDIAFVRNWKEISGTAQNILRRYSF